MSKYRPAYAIRPTPFCDERNKHAVPHGGADVDAVAAFDRHPRPFPRPLFMSIFLTGRRASEAADLAAVLVRRGGQVYVTEIGASCSEEVEAARGMQCILVRGEGCKGWRMGKRPLE